MFQRLKNKKGFTLIELIVVIAILGILALIAIPRFTGFTERARIGNDEQYGALVANATMVMISAGDLNYVADATVTIEIGADGVVDDIAVAGMVADAWYTAKITDIDDFNTELQKLVADKELVSDKYSGGMVTTVNDSGVLGHTTPTP